METSRPEVMREVAASPTAAWPAAGALITAVGAMSCCILPLVFFTVGISGAWIANLTALYPYRLYFEAAAAMFVLVGLLRLRRRARVCDRAHCRRPLSDRLLGGALWTSAVMVAAAVVYPYVAPLFLN